MADIHNYKKRLDRTLERIKESKEISKKNKKIILGYYENCVIEGLSISKIERYVYDAMRLAQFYKKDLDKATERDLKELVVMIESKTWTIHTKYTFKIGLRKIYKFIDKITEKGISPERLKWMKTNIKKSQLKLPEDLLSEAEVELMIKHATSLRNRAFIAVLYESGGRIGEIGNLRIKDIKFDEYGAIIQVHGKTGSRIIRLVQSAPYLMKWLNNHPYSENRSCYVWIKKDGEFLNATTMSGILKNSAKRAGVNKRIFPHLFRHSRATFLASHLTESQMKNVLGWSQDSGMAGIYVHLNGRDSDKAILKLNGIELEKEERKSNLQPKKCLRCETINEATNKFCKVCGFVLDKEEANKILKDDLERNNMDNLMKTLVDDKEILEYLVKKIKEKNVISKNK